MLIQELPVLIKVCSLLLLVHTHYLTIFLNFVQEFPFLFFAKPRNAAHHTCILTQCAAMLVRMSKPHRLKI